MLIALKLASAQDVPFLLDASQTYRKINHRHFKISPPRCIEYVFFALILEKKIVKTREYENKRKMVDFFFRFFFFTHQNDPRDVPTDIIPCFHQDYSPNGRGIR